MVGLKMVEIEKAPEEIRCRKVETVLKMGGKDHHFAWIGHKLALIARNPAEYLLRYPHGPVQPVYLFLAHIGAPPGAARVSREVQASSLIVAAGFFFQPFDLFFRTAGFLVHGILVPRYLELLANPGSTGEP
jgi:hypothetical protein